MARNIQPGTFMSQPGFTVLRFVLPALGGFLLGVYPGVALVYYIAVTSPISLGIAEIGFIHVLFASIGAFLGVAIVRLIYRTHFAGSDAALIIGNGLVLGLIGFLYLISLVPGT